MLYLVNMHVVDQKNRRHLVTFNPAHIVSVVGGTRELEAAGARPERVGRVVLLHDVESEPATETVPVAHVRLSNGNGLDVIIEGEVGIDARQAFIDTVVPAYRAHELDRETALQQQRIAVAQSMQDALESGLVVPRVQL